MRKYAGSFVPLLGLALTTLRLQAAPVLITIDSEPLHRGIVDQKIFGNFIELLEDVAPGMWAELLSDRSFEGILPAANWCYYDSSPDICDRAWDTNATWSLVTNNSFNGARCARLTAGAQPALLTQSGLSARKDMDYEFSGYLRADKTVRATIRLKFLLPTGEWMTLANAELPELSGTWRKVSVTMMSRGQTDHAVFELAATGAGNLWADKLSLMPADNVNGWRRDVVEVVKGVRPGVIRFGGSCVDPGHYRWKENVGDRDKRVPWTNSPWGRLDPADVGIDEFCRFCELTAAEPLICLSFADGPQNAADLVEYCNGGTNTAWGERRAANGRPASYHVKYWQVGNEINGDDPEYLRQLPEFITKIRQADPKIELMTSFPGPKLLAQSGKDIAWVCPHHYTADLAECERDFTRIGDLLEHTTGCADIKIGVTEWNTDAGSWGLGRGKFATLEVALMNARYLNLMMRHCDKVKIGCRSNLANSYCGAIIETSPAGTGVLKRPSYYVMELFAKHALPRPLRLKASDERLDVFAGAAQDQSAVVLFAINPKPESVPLALEFRGFTNPLRLLKAETVCDTRNAGQPDVMNHWDAPDRVKILPLAIANEAVLLPPLSATAIECKAMLR